MERFRCKVCEGLVIQEREEDERGKGVWWYHCQTSGCGRYYGRPIFEKDLDYHGPIEIFSPGLAPWVSPNRFEAI
jgi:hypothetical protein